MGNGEILDTIWEVSDHLWEQVWPVILEIDPPKFTGRKRVDARRHHLSDAERLPVESPAQGARRRQHHPSNVPTLGRAWSGAAYLGRLGGRM